MDRETIGEKFVFLQKEV